MHGETVKFSQCISLLIFSTNIFLTIKRSHFFRDIHNFEIYTLEYVSRIKFTPVGSSLLRHCRRVYKKVLFRSDSTHISSSYRSALSTSLNQWLYWS